MGGYGYAQFHPQRSLPAATEVEIRNLISQQLENKSDLTTAQLRTTATVILRQNRTWGGLTLGETNLVYQGVGDVQAGIDLQKLQAKQVDPQQRRIHLLLPPPQITHVSLDVQQSSVLAHYKRWFGPDTALEMQQTAQRQALQQITAQACQQDLLTTTNSNAQQRLTTLLQTAGYQQVIIDTQPGTCAPPSPA